MLFAPSFGKRRSVAEAAFTPVSLDNANRVVFWYDPQDDATAWQGDGVTPLTTDVTQTYYRLDDKGGTANHVVQATSGTRPTRITYSGIKHVKFMGFTAAKYMLGANLNVTLRTNTYVCMGMRYEKPDDDAGFFGIGGIEKDTTTYSGIGTRAGFNRVYAFNRGPNGVGNLDEGANDRVSTSETRVFTSIMADGATASSIRSQGVQRLTGNSLWLNADTVASCRPFLGPYVTGNTDVSIAQMVVVITDGPTYALTGPELASLEEYVRVKSGAPVF